MNLKAVLEGILFIEGDEGIALDDLLEILETNKETLNKLIIELCNDYEKEDRGITLEFYGKKLKMVTKKEHSNYYKKLFEKGESKTLTSAALETLAIIAYNQPVTRVTIDEIRGVSSAHLVRKLLFLNLIKEVGKSDIPGKPNLYGVTEEFLDYFGINSLDELPEITIEESVTEETDLFDSKYKEI